MSKKPLSFRPSPHFLEYLESSKEGLTATLNGLYDRYRALCELEAIRLTEEEQAVLAKMIKGHFIDTVAIQTIPQDVIETGHAGLIAKLQNATYSQVLATMERYGCLNDS